MSGPLERSQSADQEMRSGGAEANRTTRSNPFRAFGNRLRALRDGVRDRLRRSDRGSEAAQQTGPEGEQLPSYGLARAERQEARDRAAHAEAEKEKNDAETHRKLALSSLTYDPDGSTKTRKHAARLEESKRRFKHSQSDGNLAEQRRRAAEQAGPPPPLPGYGEGSGLESESRSPEDIEARRRVMEAKRRQVNSERQQDRENDGNDNDKGGLGH
jgi:hypothetical protein